MNQIPVDTRSMTFSYLATVPKNDLNGQQTRNADGVPKWEVQLLCAAELARRPEVLPVTIAATNPPELAPMSEVMVENLTARAWDNNGRSGVAFSADVIRPSGKANRPPTPSTNGNKAPEPAGAPS